MRSSMETKISILETLDESEDWLNYRATQESVELLGCTHDFGA